MLGFNQFYAPDEKSDWCIHTRNQRKLNISCLVGNSGRAIIEEWHLVDTNSSFQWTVSPKWIRLDDPNESLVRKENGKEEWEEGIRITDAPRQAIYWNAKESYACNLSTNRKRRAHYDLSRRFRFSHNLMWYPG